MPKTIPVSQEIKEAVLKTKANQPLLSGRKIAELFGLHQKTVNKILNEILNKDVSPKMWSGILRTEKTAEERIPPASSETEGPQPSEEVFNDEVTGQWAQGKHYTYNGDNDVYISFIKSRPNPLVISGTKFRAMKKAYSDWDGHKSTINEVCRRFSIPRDQFIELKTIHGWTHDSEPFSKEEVLVRETDDLVEDAFQQRRQAVWESFEKKKWLQTKVDAEKWNNLEQNFILPLQEHITNLVPQYHIPTLLIRSPRNPFAVVTNTAELHYGKRGWVYETGEEYGRAEAAQRLTTARQNMLEEVADRGVPEVFYQAVGNDYLTIDTDNGTTTRGTGQDLDGSAAQIYSEGFDLNVQDIDTLLQVAPVHILGIPGNHDHLLSIALLKGLQAWYRNNPRVVIEFSARSRAYVDYGNTDLGFAHGDGALKPKDYMATMAYEDPEKWARTIYRAFFTGHFHSEVVRELIGGTHYQMPSLSGKDRYHEKNAYLAEAAMASYVVDKYRGVTSTIMTRVR